MEKVDEIVARLLTEKFRLGLFEQPYADENRISLQSENARRLARETATRSITLLENNGALPLKPEQRVAVIGPTADDPLALLSGYSFPVHLIISDMQDRGGAGHHAIAGAGRHAGQLCARLPYH